MKKAKVLWLIYRKLRPALGISVAFILMSGIFLGVFNFQLLVAASGFFFIELFAAFYNDYWDFSEDIKNNRKDKFTTCGIISTRACLYISLLFAFIAFIFLLFTDVPLLILGIPYLILGFVYSHEKFRLKGRVIGYAILSSPFFMIPIIIALTNGISLLRALPVSAFLFFQYIYILCQKDSTDTRDKKNVFLTHGWKKSSNIIMFFGISASIPFLLLCLSSPPLIFLWIFNTFLKFLNINDLRRMVVTRTRRGRLILLEFATPYLYLVGGVL